MRKMTDKQEKIFDDLMDMYEFEVYENDEGKLQVNDLQGACLGGICGEVFDDKFDIIKRMEVYHLDYIVEPLYWEFDKSFDTMAECLDFLTERRKNIDKQEEDWDYTIEILKFLIACEEENKRKVYVLIVDSATDYITERGVKVFANQKDVEEAFKDEVLSAKLDAGEDWEVEESDMSFSTYDDGYYAMNHIDVVVLEKEIIL